jgi:hypothetical protein
VVPAAGDLLHRMLRQCSVWMICTARRKFAADGSAMLAEAGL